MRYLSFFILIILLFTNCNDGKNINYQAINTATSSKMLSNDGKQLLEQKCYACHSPSATMQNRLAPPMIAVKNHYLSDDITKKQFVAAIWNWVEKPAIENSKMKGAVRRFGLMPYQTFEKSEIEVIANYMFENDIEQPDWFEEHLNDMKDNKH